MLNFRLISEFQTIHRRPFVPADTGALKPTDSRPFVDGEWLELDSSYHMARGGDDNATTEDHATVPSFAIFAEQGRYETQAIQKLPMLYLNQYEAETLIFDASAGAGVTVVGQPLFVADIDIGGIVRRGLAANAGSPSGNEFVVGYVTRLPSANNNWLRFIVK